MRLLVLIAAPALLGCGPRQFVQPCRQLGLPDEALEVTAPPFTQVRRASLRLRLETRELAEVPVAIERGDGEPCPAVLVPDVDRATRAWVWPEAPDEGFAHPDQAGDHTLHTLLLPDLEPGQAFDWLAGTTPEQATSPQGRIARPQALGGTGRVAFTGSLAPGIQADLAALVAAEEADLWMLTGDLQDTDLDGSTWSRLLHDLAPATSTSLLHTVPGDRDIEDFEVTGDEGVELYDRWFGEQGRPGGQERSYTVDVAGVRFIVVDTADDRLGVSGSRQGAWLDNELDDLALDETVREAVVVMHQGPFSLADQRPALELRTDFVDRLAEGGVRLVISGHAHGYERFDVDGITFVNDGGGGAPLGDLEHRDDAELAAARQASSATHGLTLLDIRSDGALVVSRLDVEGTEIDRVDLPVPE